jgi:bifunctional N-acetylglucosamine-1-phosphate-uridyltransferase/glucosamine-1-phosphate-acetyltransferase GlmU-like protein
MNMVSVSVAGIILRVDNPDFFREKSYLIKIFGRTMAEWVSLSLGDAPFVYADYDGVSEIAERVRPLLTGAEYTVVLFSDTPLIQRKTVLEAIEYTVSGGLNVCRMTRGYVFKTEFLRETEKIYTEKRRYFSEESDFITAEGFERLALVSDTMKQRIMAHYMQNGVHIVDSASTFIDGGVIIGRGVTIFPNNHIKGETVIADNVTLEENNVIDSCIISEGCVITSSKLINSFIGRDSTVGPYAYIRPECVIGEHCRIGDFTEIKRSRIGAHTKISHLSYVGDCETGEYCNVGCGVVTVNFDGVSKHKTVIGDKVFVGSNSNLIAPVTIGDNAFIAAGSTVTDGVPERALAIARARLIIKPDWVD